MRTILLVDNDLEFRQTMATIVRRAGFRVIQADSGSYALERVFLERPSLIMMDLEIASVQKTELTAWLRNDLLRYKIPLVVYAAEQARSRIDETLPNVAAEVLSKPLSFTVVRDVLQKHLRAFAKRPRPIPSPCLVPSSL
jgi:CheY-like chemotaxis protein